MNRKHPLISILMPVRNAGPFLVECINSILAQTERDWELIAVNDGSTDNSYRTLCSFAQKDERILVVQNNGSGIIDALRTAFDRSSGRFITRMDADDRMMPHKLEILCAGLQHCGKGHVAIGQVRYFSSSTVGAGYINYANWLNRLTLTGTNYTDIYRECVIPSPCWMVHRDDLERCDAFRADIYPEDYDLCFRFYRERLRPIPCATVLHEWRDHPDRTSRNDPHYADNRFIELKLDWFLKLDHDPNKTLVLWGAGGKGKRIARQLTEKQIPFRWVCNNPQKIGKHIGQTRLEAIEPVLAEKQLQLIIAVANPDEQQGIREQTRSMERFFFC